MNDPTSNLTGFGLFLGWLFVTAALFLSQFWAEKKQYSEKVCAPLSALCFCWLILSGAGLFGLFVVGAVAAGQFAANSLTSAFAVIFK